MVPTTKESGVFMSKPEDIEWLLTTHIKSVLIEIRPFKSFTLFGREDCPSKLHLYEERDPLYTTLPSQMLEATEDGGWKEVYASLDELLDQLSADGGLKYGTLNQAWCLRCPFAIIDLNHYYPDGTCRCNDPIERVRMKKEWKYTERDFKKAGLKATKDLPASPTDLTLAQRAALRIILYGGSHQAYDQGQADKLSLPFGRRVKCWPEKVNTDPKGVLMPGMKKGTVVYRTGGWILMGNAASQLGVEWESAMGRGTEFRRAYEAIYNQFLKGE